VKSRVKKLSRRDPGTARVSPRVCFGSAPGASASASVSGQRSALRTAIRDAAARGPAVVALNSGVRASTGSNRRRCRRDAGNPKGTQTHRSIPNSAGGSRCEKASPKGEMFVALRCGWRRRRPRNEGVRDSNPRAGFRWIAGFPRQGQRLLRGEGTRGVHPPTPSLVAKRRRGAENSRVFRRRHACGLANGRAPAKATTG